ncbi:MAG: ParA family protein [Alphaproteobacteria bacterium]|nr:ParA family protein [Alphaproteobacteria bacterium]
MPGKVIAAATGKGGAGKSTVIACLATYWASKGSKVALIDADPNQTLARWHSKGSALAGLPLKVETDEHAIIPTVAAFVADHDIVLIDCAGFGNQVMIFAIGSADLVVIPVMTDEASIFEALKTRKIVESASQLVKKPIRSRTLLCRVKRSAVAVHARAQLVAFHAEPLTGQLNDRVAFQEATFHGSSPTALLPRGGAARDVDRVAKELEADIWSRS